LGISDAAVGIIAIALGGFITFFGQRFLEQLIMALGGLGVGVYAATCASMLKGLLVSIGFPQEHYGKAVWGTVLVAGLVGAVVSKYT
jgi:hypothetical protein